MQPNYLIELLNFQDKLIYQTIQLSTGQICLWYALLSINNKAGWKEWFTASTKVLIILTGLSRSGIEKARKKLKEEGLIEYKSNGTNATSYKLIFPDGKDSKKNKKGGSNQKESVIQYSQGGEQEKGQASDTNRSQQGEQGKSTLNKLKQNKIKTKTKNKKTLSSSQKKNDDANSKKIDEIVSYLNKATGADYNPQTKATIKLINGRLSENFTVDDFKKVIDKKSKEWLNTTMAQYLRPTTLFAPSNFEGYLRAPTGTAPAGVAPNKNNRFTKPIPKWFDKPDEPEPKTNNNENMEEMPF